MKTPESDYIILKILFKEFTVKWTITSLAKEVNMSRVGIWKALKRLEAKKLIFLSSIGNGKTSAFYVSLNWKNMLLEKTLSLILTEDALKIRRWLSNFAELENKVDFLLLFGSIIKLSKEANDIDILGVISDKNNFLNIEEAVQKMQKTQAKKIHSVNFTEAEFMDEIKKPNKVYIDAIKKGVVLFGQDKFIRFIKELR